MTKEQINKVERVKEKLSGKSKKDGPRDDPRDGPRDGPSPRGLKIKNAKKEKRLRNEAIRHMNKKENRWIKSHKEYEDDVKKQEKNNEKYFEQ